MDEKGFQVNVGSRRAEWERDRKDDAAYWARRERDLRIMAGLPAQSEADADAGLMYHASPAFVPKDVPTDRVSDPICDPDWFHKPGGFPHLNLSGDPALDYVDDKEI